MAKDIAVYVDDMGNTAPINSNGKVVVYRRNADNWNVTKELKVTFDKSKGVKELRKKMDEIIVFLEGCKIFLAHTVMGIAYFSLEKAGFSIWEYEGEPLDFLNYILEKEEVTENELPVTTQGVIPLPKFLGNGMYSVSIKEIQESNSNITSKNVLLPFLRKEKFYSLEVICNHVPLWLESEMLNLNYKFNTQKINASEFIVLIERKVCCE